MLDLLWTVAPWVALTIATVTLIVLASAAYRLRVRLGRQDASLQALRGDVDALCAGAVGLGERQNELDRHLRRLLEKLEQIELRDPGERPYTEAIRMVHRGAATEDLVKGCGLSRGEAELIATLHGVRRAG